MITILKTFFGVMIFAGIFLILGAAGSDCDGKCMENSMTISELLTYSFTGLVLLATGAFGLSKIGDY
jgi:hypothetical protein